MDKNTITGFILIGALVFAFSWFNKPSEEQIAQRKRYNDSIAALQSVEEKEANQAI